MNNIINASIQIVPLHTVSEEAAFSAIDDAIQVIRESGLRFEVGPMATVVEGTYDDVMQGFKSAQEATLIHTDQIVVNIHLHIDKSKDVHFEHKTGHHKPEGL